MPSILKGNNESLKDVLVHSKFFAYTLGMACEELTDPSGTGESGIMIGYFVVVCLWIINCSKGRTDGGSGGSLNDKILLLNIFFFICVVVVIDVDVHDQLIDWPGIRVRQTDLNSGSCTTQITFKVYIHVIP